MASGGKYFPPSFKDGQIRDASDHGSGDYIFLRCMSAKDGFPAQLQLKPGI